MGGVPIPEQPRGPDPGTGSGAEDSRGHTGGGGGAAHTRTPPDPGWGVIRALIFVIKLVCTHSPWVSLGGPPLRPPHMGVPTHTGPTGLLGGPGGLPQRYPKATAGGRGSGGVCTPRGGVFSGRGDLFRGAVWGQSSRGGGGLCGLGGSRGQRLGGAAQGGGVGPGDKHPRGGPEGSWLFPTRGGPGGVRGDPSRARPGRVPWFLGGPGRPRPGGFPVGVPAMPAPAGS